LIRCVSSPTQKKGVSIGKKKKETVMKKKKFRWTGKKRRGHIDRKSILTSDIFRKGYPKSRKIWKGDMKCGGRRKTRRITRVGWL